MLPFVVLYVANFLGKFYGFFFQQEFLEYTNFDECLEFIEDYMIKNGPFDGLLGFSQVYILDS